MNSDTYLYTFSTICQTLAGAFGFLVAVVLYQTQNLVAAMRASWLDLRGQAEIAGREAGDCEIRGDWSGIARLVSAWLSAEKAPSLESEAKGRQLIAEASRLESIQGRLRLCVRLTFGTITFSLVALACNQYLASHPILGFLGLIVAVGFAIGTMFTYLPLIWALSN